jgi:hypothetical protein
MSEVDKSAMNRAVVESRQRICESYLALRHLCASVARADEAIAKSRRMIEQHQASAPAMMDHADEATPLERLVDHHRASRKAVMGKMAIDSDARKMAARIVQSFREAGFGCELLNPLSLH